jgi:hypothetical protein
MKKINPGWEDPSRGWPFLRIFEKGPVRFLQALRILAPRASKEA